MTRQGVRWRFWRIYNDIYVSAFETILFIEKIFGSQLREHAIRISRERHALRQDIMRTGFQTADVFQPSSGSGRAKSARKVGAARQQ